MSLRVITPTQSDRAEQAGRAYEAMDIERAIESGQLTSLADVRRRVRQTASNTHAVMKCEQWLIRECCLDMQATIKNAGEG